MHTPLSAVVPAAWSQPRPLADAASEAWLRVLFQAAGYTIGSSVQEEILEMIDREADGA